VVGITNQRRVRPAVGARRGPAARARRRVAVPSDHGLLPGLRDRGLQGLIEERTGLTIDPLFSASKIRWLPTPPPGPSAGPRPASCARGRSTAGCCGTSRAGPSTRATPLPIRDFDQPRAWFTVPTGRVMAPGTGTMHLILAVTDHGTPRLTRYRRVIVEVVP